MFCRITADEERRVSRRIVVVQHPSRFSHNSGLFQRTESLKRAKNFLVQLFVYHLTTCYKFMMDSAFPIKKHNPHHLDLWPTHPCFLWSRRPFPHPLRRLHLGFNTTPIDPRLIFCYDVLKKVLITICIWQAVLDWFQHDSLSDGQSTNAARIFALKRRIWSFFQ